MTYIQVCVIPVYKYNFLLDTNIPSFYTLITDSYIIDYNSVMRLEIQINELIRRSQKHELEQQPYKSITRMKYRFSKKIMLTNLYTL